MWGGIITEVSFMSNFHIGFNNTKSDILLHLTQWQYWWWFWFSYFWVLYFLLFMRIFRYRALKFKPRIVTSYRPHGKWGDLIVCLLPVSWCVNIITNSNFILRMIEWQAESSLFTLRVRGKQWYWVYKYELKAVTDILTAPKNIGNNKWVLSNPLDLQVADDFLHIHQLRSQNRWAEIYWSQGENPYMLNTINTADASADFGFLNFYRLYKEAPMTRKFVSSVNPNVDSFLNKNLLTTADFSFFLGKRKRAYKLRVLFDSLLQHIYDDKALEGLKIMDADNVNDYEVDFYSGYSLKFTPKNPDHLKWYDDDDKLESLNKRLPHIMNTHVRRRFGDTSHYYNVGKEFKNLNRNILKNQSQLNVPVKYSKLFTQVTDLSYYRNLEMDDYPRPNFDKNLFEKFVNLKNKYNFVSTMAKKHIALEDAVKEIYKSIISENLYYNTHRHQNILNTEFRRIESSRIIRNFFSKDMVVSNIPPMDTKTMKILYKPWTQPYIMLFDKKLEAPIENITDTYKNLIGLARQTDRNVYRTAQWTSLRLSRILETHSYEILADNNERTKILQKFNRFFIKFLLNSPKRTLSDIHRIGLKKFDKFVEVEPLFTSSERNNINAIKQNIINTNSFNKTSLFFLNEAKKIFFSQTPSLKDHSLIPVGGTKDFLNHWLNPNLNQNKLNLLEHYLSSKYFKKIYTVDPKIDFNTSLNILTEKSKNNFSLFLSKNEFNDNILKFFYLYRKEQIDNISNLKNVFDDTIDGGEFLNKINIFGNPRFKNFSVFLNSQKLIYPLFTNYWTQWVAPSINFFQIELAVRQSVQFEDLKNANLIIEAIKNKMFTSDIKLSPEMHVTNQAVLNTGHIIKKSLNVAKNNKLLQTYTTKIAFREDVFDMLKSDFQLSLNDAKFNYPRNLHNPRVYFKSLKEFIPHELSHKNIPDEYKRLYMMGSQPLSKSGLNWIKFANLPVHHELFENEFVAFNNHEDSTLFRTSFIQHFNDKVFKPSRAVFTHSDFNESVFEVQKGNAIHQPVRIIKYPLNFLKSNRTKNDLIELFRLRFGSGTQNIENRSLSFQTYWIFKQKRYKLISSLKTKTRWFFDTQGRKISQTKDPYLPFVENNRLILDNKKNAMTVYKFIKTGRKRHENISLPFNKRLLRTRRIVVLPAHTNITVITNSFDVVHSWFIPGLGLKMDCIPGRSTHHVLHIDNVGFYYGQCAEICGRYHHHMPIRICALPFEHFMVWWHAFAMPRLLKISDPKFSKQMKYAYASRKYVW